MLDWITNTIRTLSYPGIALLMLLENLFPPLPSELIMPLAGYVASRGELNTVGVIVAGTLGSVLGALPLYCLGRRLGEERIRAWADQHGHWVALSGEDIERAKQWLDRHGGAAVLVCRLVPGIRSVISIPAGVDQMPLPTFLAYTTVGAGVWTALLTGAGHLLGANFPQVEKFLGPVSTVVLVGIAVAFVVRVVRERGRRRAA
jgi:membrane protein DedA with SNARE-associated domain